MNLDTNSQLNQPSSDNAEIDLGFLLNIFLRNKKLIALISSFFFISSIIFGKLQKKVWSGQFEIVLNSNNNASSVIDNLNGEVELCCNIKK